MATDSHANAVAAAARGQIDAVAPTVVSSFIQGTFVPAADQHRIPIFDPASGRTIAELCEANANEVDAAVQSAARAFPTWSGVAVAQRQQILYAIEKALLQNFDALVDLECEHTGLPLSILRSLHIPRAAHNFRFFGEYISQASGRYYDQAAGFETTVRYEPVGVCALIGPWNVPLGLGLMKVAAAIAFGNTCVLKPSEQTPMSFPLAMELMRDAGLPDGVVNLVNGRGEVTGRALTEHPLVERISFTGGTETARHIGVAAARRIKPVTMELGGKSANIVFADADFDRALDAAMVAAFSNNGQQCLAGSRILVQREIADEFIAAFTARARNLRVGDPRAESTELGPLSSAAHRDRVLAYVNVAKEEGCDVLVGDGQAGDAEGGYYVDPIVVRAPANDRRVCQEEIFGPFATLLVFDDEEEVVAVANDSAYGLVAYLWTDSSARVQRLVARLEAGVVWVNTPIMRELRAPFGGYKDSGIGREGGDACRAFYTEEKTVTISRGDTLIPRLGVQEENR